MRETVERGGVIDISATVVDVGPVVHVDPASVGERDRAGGCVFEHWGYEYVASPEISVGAISEPSGIGVVEVGGTSEGTAFVRESVSEVVKVGEIFITEVDKFLDPVGDGGVCIEVRFGSAGALGVSSHRGGEDSEFDPTEVEVRVEVVDNESADIGTHISDTGHRRVDKGGDLSGETGPGALDVAGPGESGVVLHTGSSGARHEEKASVGEFGLQAVMDSALPEEREFVVNLVDGTALMVRIAIVAFRFAEIHPPAVDTFAGAVLIEAGHPIHCIGI